MSAAAVILKELILTDADDLAHENLCTAARLDKRASFLLFVGVAMRGAEKYRYEALALSDADVYACAALLQEHYSQHVIRFLIFKQIRNQSRQHKKQ